MTADERSELDALHTLLSSTRRRVTELEEDARAADKHWRDIVARVTKERDVARADMDDAVERASRAQEDLASVRESADSRTAQLDAMIERERMAHAESTKRVVFLVNELNRLRESGILQDNAKSIERRISALELRVIALETER